MANWKKIFKDGEDLVITGAVGGTRKINASYTNAVGSTGANLQIDAGGGHINDGELRLGANNTNKIVATPLVEYASNLTFNDEKQLISKKYADELVENTTTANTSSGAIPQTDKLLIYRTDETGQKSMEIDHFFEEYTNINESTVRDRTFKLNGNALLQAPNHWQINEVAHRVNASSLNAYYGVDTSGTATKISTITGTTDTTAYWWQLDRASTLIGKKSHLNNIRVVSSNSGTSANYDVDVWKVSAAALDSSLATSAIMTIEHIHNWAETPTAASKMIQRLHTPSSDVLFEAGDRLMVTIQRTSSPAVANPGRYLYYGYTASFTEYMG
tara:strand:+ start:777 stop:1763 length:987 start_codon:yes stop_codon:yes gene_type:complete